MNENKTLTNKYRPQCFNNVIGQQLEIKSILSNLKKGELRPLVLIGERGTGKTTTARLIAAYVNCLNEEKNISKKCECDNCERVRKGNLPDFQEIDGASNNGVDYVRYLQERLLHSPQSKCRVIIIDEAHMFTKFAFNAFLKILEEPPKKTLFILCTTEPNKIIPTIMSRCSQHYFNLVHLVEIRALILKILYDEGYINKFSDDVIDLIVANGKGSVRDTIKELGKIIYLEDASEADYTNLLKGLDNSLLKELFINLFSYNVTESLLRLQTIFETGIPPQDLYNRIETYLQGVLVFKYGLSEVDDDNFEHIAKLANSKNISDFLQIFWRITSNTLNIKKLVFEVIILEYCKDFSEEIKPKMNLNKNNKIRKNNVIKPTVLEKQPTIFSKVTELEYIEEYGF